MIKKTWTEFEETGLLTLMNTFLRVFGWTIHIEKETDDYFLDVYPARVEFKNVSTEHSLTQDRISKFIRENADEIYGSK